MAISSKLAQLVMAWDDAISGRKLWNAPRDLSWALERPFSAVNMEQWVDRVGDAVLVARRMGYHKLAQELKIVGRGDDYTTLFFVRSSADVIPPAKDPVAILFTAKDAVGFMSYLPIGVDTYSIDEVEVPNA